MNKIALLIFFFAASIAEAKTVRYELAIQNQRVNLSGKKDVDFALAVNGSIPAPTLEFTEGDDAEITVINKLADEEASVHWHGILLPPEEDGVAYVNTPPIFPGQKRTFKFKLRQHGTYWYHSHTMLQEQKGVFGAFIIHPKKETIKYDKEAVVMLNDWTDENPDQVLSNLKKDGDYYLYKKKTVRSWLGAIKTGSLKTYLSNEWTRMGGMDVSDVGYDAFLINGKNDSQLLVAHPGEKVRLRIINAGASSYFYVSLAGLPMKVVSADGTDIEPTFAKEILMGMAETYDVVFTVPEHKNFELRATSQDGTGHASTWIGMGEKASVADRAATDLYAPMDHSAHAGHGNHKEMVDESKIIPTLTVDTIKSLSPTTLPKDKKIFELKLTQTGDMARYIWHINGETIMDDTKVTIDEGDVVRFVFENKTMMHHPMHLHGHFFRVLNQYGDYSPLKHTVDVPPHGSRTIEFYANEPGEWMLHCHNLYHMKSGMARVISYRSFVPSKEIQHLQMHDPHLHEHIYFTGSVDAFTNLGEVKLRGSQTWNTLELRGERKKELSEWQNEADAFYRRWFNQYTSLVAGASYFHEETRGVVGLGYILPLLIESHLLLDSRGKLRLDLGKRFQWTSTIFSEAEVRLRDGFGADWTASLMYGSHWHWAAGFKFTEGNVGVGLQWKF